MAGKITEIIHTACGANTVVIMDVEIFHNYFLVGAYHYPSGNYMGITTDNLDLLEAICENPSVCIVGFNNQYFDNKIINFILANRKEYSPENLVELAKQFCDRIIEQREVDEDKAYRWWNRKSKILDLKAVCGNSICPSLKKLESRMQMKEIESLPIAHDAILTDAQKAQILEYNKKDIKATKTLLESLCGELELRGELTKLYGVECHSMSNAQIAEAVLRAKVQMGPSTFDGGFYPVEDLVPTDLTFVDAGLQAFYKDLLEMTIKFEKTYDVVKQCVKYKPSFVKASDAKFEAHEFIVGVGDRRFAFRLGGLHSVHDGTQAGKDAVDVDVASYYPNLMLTRKIAPAHCGKEFLKVYGEITKRRIEAKKAGRKLEADSCKLILNSTYGKTGSIWSRLFDPTCTVSVCLTGELLLLKLVDMYASKGIKPVFVNTDGALMERQDDAVMAEWQAMTGLTLEETPVAKYFVRDSNNVLLQYSDGKLKCKGAAFAYKPSREKDVAFPIVTEAIVKLLIDGIPIYKTISECKNPYSFMATYVPGRTITDCVVGVVGENKNIIGERINGIFRYFLSITSQGKLYRKGSGSWVRVSDVKSGVRQCNVAPDTLPEDLNINRYVELAAEKLQKILKGSLKLSELEDSNHEEFDEC